MTKLMLVAQNHLDGLLFFGVARQLAAQGIDAITVSYMRFPYRHRPTDIDAILFETFGQRHNPAALLADWNAVQAWLKAEYPDVDLDQLVISDKALSFVIGLARHRRSRTQSRAIAAAYIKAWEDLLDQEQPDQIFTFADGCLVFRTLYAVTNRRGIPTYCGLYAPFRGRMFWVDNEYFQLTDYVDQPLDAYTPDEQAAMRDYLEQTRRSEFQLMRRRRRRLTSKMRQFAEYTWIKLRHEMGYDHWTPLKWGMQYVRRVWRSRREQALYDNVVAGEPYFFFPLHDPVDSQLGVRAPQFLDQFALIDRLAAALPAGHRLYIKPHPLQIGAYPLRDLRRVLATGRVRLLDPHLAAHQVIAGSQGVVTINSNAGLEGILFQKPVIVLGRPYYAHKGFTLEVGDLSTVGEVMQRALDDGHVAASDDDLVRFLLNLRRITYEGDVLFFLTAENEYMHISDAVRTLPSSPYIDQFSRSIADALSRHPTALNAAARRSP